MRTTIGASRVGLDRSYPFVMMPASPHTAPAAVAAKPAGAALLAVAILLAGCTDAATRIAYDLEKGAGALRRSSDATHCVEHAPKRLPEGCGEAYAVQFSASSSLVIWCKDAGNGKVTSSHSTTYHLRFVKVPRTLNIEKSAGERLSIELEKRGTEIIVVNVR